MSKKIIWIVGGITAVLLAVAGAVFLPDQVVMQISFSGEVSRTASKTVAVILPLVVSAIGLYFDKTEQSNKGLLLLFAGDLVAMISLLVNLLVF